MKDRGNKNEPTLLIDELADLCDEATERPAMLTVSLKRTVDGFPGKRVEVGRAEADAAKPRGCLV